MQYLQPPPVTKQLLDGVVHQIVDAGSPLKVVLFGSQARGDATPNSDLDLLIIENSDLPTYKRTARYYIALGDLLIAHDILVRTPAEVEQWKHEPNAFVTTALREGKVLYERVE